MSKIHVGQTLDLRLDTGLSNLATAQLLEIHYRKPNQATGKITASHDGTNLRTILAPGFLDQPGRWSFWSYVQFDNNTLAPGDKADVQIFAKGY
ncbi:MAG: hypothetical protein FD170_3394 [Bacteroidetes bacterium]|nr:MAG: hypothetical protein FD170_3394 [Bacteroidota bacterium]